MGFGSAVREIWGRVVGVEASKGVDAERKTLAAPFGVGSLLMPYRAPGVGHALPKPTVANLRRFAEMPVARRAINCIKDRIACMDWRIEAKPGALFPTHDDDEAVVMNGAPDGVAFSQAERAGMLRRMLEEPNGTDSFRTLIEQVIEDLLVSGCGAVEMESSLPSPPGLKPRSDLRDGNVRAEARTLQNTRPSSLADQAHPVVRLYPVDSATLEINPAWSGAADEPRYRQVTGRIGSGATASLGGGSAVPLLDDELMYVRLNPRTHTPFGLGKVEVAFEAINQFLQAHRYAARVAGNGVVQYALWMKDRTPEQQERLTRWWQEDVEGSGRVPVLTSEDQPQVLRLAMGTDAELRLGWQEFLLSMIANAFDLPAMMLGVTNDVNRSTATELADEAFQNAVVPLAKLLAEHITRDVIAKKLGWSDLRFVWSDLETRDQVAEMEIQTKLLAAGVLSVDEVRAMRGLPVS